MIPLIVFIALMVWYGLGIFVSVMSIGKEPKPTTPAHVTLQLLVMGFIIWAISANWDWS